MKNISHSLDYLDAYGARIVELVASTITTTNFFTTNFTTDVVIGDTATIVNLTSTTFDTSTINATTSIDTVNLTVTGLFTVGDVAAQTLTANDATIPTIDGVTLDFTTGNIDTVNATAVNSTNVTVTNHVNSNTIACNTLTATGAATVGSLTTGNLTSTGTFSSTGIITASQFQTSPTYDPFNYTEGTWTPTIRCAFSAHPFAIPSAYLGDWVGAHSGWNYGYYVKIGSKVSLWYRCGLTIPGVNNDVGQDEYQYPIITELPYTCAKVDTSDEKFTSQMSTSSFPNGYFNGVPIPLIGVAAEPFTAVLIEQNAEYTPLIAPGYDPVASYTSTGREMFIECIKRQFSPPPVYGMVWERNGTLSNANITSTGNYAVEFQGQMTYFTDQ